MQEDKPIRVTIRPSAWALIRQVGRDLARWTGGQLLIALAVAACYAVGFALAGLPWWPLFAVANGFFHLIPIAGVALSLLLPVTGWLVLTNGDARTLLWVVAVCILVQAFEGFYLTPKILGEKLRMKPLAVFVAVVAGSALFGFVGAFFAVPALAVAMTVWRWWYGDPRVKKPRGV
ncbi:MAG: AI-2E family transporter [Bryobacterales bacterium]|nr:AI-2E family transporter [Bryobacterales bacterium]